MLKNTSIQNLKTSKNLLAFSAGGDSTALLFLLLEKKISFDIAIVDYGLRLQSKEEVLYAQDLAKTYNFNCFVHSAKKIDSNFEANARKIRYDFFETLIEKHNYTSLLTAHHLGDRFEWMLMQFCKGAGAVELVGMKEKEQREKYEIIRPLLHLEKQELLSFLQDKDIHYFEDESNTDEKYKRNYFRTHHTKPLLQKYLSGIKKSFAYLDEDVDSLVKNVDVTKLDDFAYFTSTQSKRSDIVGIDKYLKNLGFLISANEKKQLKEQTTTLIARKIIVNQEHGFVFIAPYTNKIKMEKMFKEKMRKLKIEPKLRAYLHTNKKVETLITSLLS